MGRISTGKGENNVRKERGGKILGRKGRRSGRKGLRGESPTGKGGLRGGERPWEGSQQGKGGEDLKEERGGEDVRERETIWEKRT